MKGELPSLKPKDIIAALVKAGFQVKRQTGSHVILFKIGISRPISVPMHIKDLPKGTCRAIIRQSSLTIEEFLKYLH